MELEQVYCRFDVKFSKNRDVPMALYGLGINTKYLLEKAKDYNIIGIVANERIGEYIYGKPIISIKDIQDKVKIIVIVAQTKSIKIIYDRIKYVETNGIEIYDIWGERVRDVFGDEQYVMQNKSHWNSSFDKLKSEIDKHEIISFEVFDTLIMRKVFTAHHILEIIELELKEEYDYINFKRERIKAENELLEQGMVPTIEEIYNLLSINTGIDEKLSYWLMQKEFEIEQKFSIKRQCIVDALEYAKIQGKRIYFLADTYFSSVQIYELLLKCSITEVNIDNILTSGDIKKTKRDGSLFEFFINYSGIGSKLHIGSNRKTDIEMAEKFGIDTYFVMSSYEMLLKSSICNVIEDAMTIDDYIVLGTFAAKAFNNPFTLSQSKGKFKIDNMYDLGYYCFAPITLKFLNWSFDKIRNNNNSVILFSSRDGYFICELYNNLRKRNEHLSIPKGIYFYISRRAVTVANIRTADDIVEIVESVLRLSIGNLSEILEQRLGVVFHKNDFILNRPLIDALGENNKSEIVERVLAYKDTILKNADKERENFLKYVQKNNLQDYDKIYLFDLYTKGTVLCNFSNIINRRVELLCYAVKDFPNEFISTMDNVKSMFSNNELLDSKWFERSYQLFEVVYSSQEGQVKCFDDKGNPCFIEHSEYNYEYVKETQKGILDFINDLEIIYPQYYKLNFNLNMVDSISKIMIRKQSITSEDIHNGFTYYDSFASEAKLNIWDMII